MGLNYHREVLLPTELTRLVASYIVFLGVCLRLDNKVLKASVVYWCFHLFIGPFSVFATKFDLEKWTI